MLLLGGPLLEICARVRIEDELRAAKRRRWAEVARRQSRGIQSDVRHQVREPAAGPPGGSTATKTWNRPSGLD